MTRTEHLQWAKDRALAYINTGDVKNGILSMLSDLGKHEELQTLQTPGFLISFGIATKAEARKWVEGFN